MNPTWPAYFSGGLVGLVQPPTNFHVELNLDFERLVIHFKTRWGWHFPGCFCFVFHVSLDQYADHSEEFLAIHPPNSALVVFSQEKRHLVTFTCESGHWTILDQEWFKLIDTNQSGEITVRKLIIAMMRYQASEPGLVHQETSLVLGLQQINYHKISFGSELFFLSHTTSSHLDAQSDFIQDTGCASSINKWQEDLFFCSSIINLLWDDQWWIAVAGDEPPQSKPWNRKAIEISNIKKPSWVELFAPRVGCSYGFVSFLTCRA